MLHFLVLKSVPHFAGAVFYCSALLSFILFVKLECQRTIIREMLVVYHLVNSVIIKQILVFG